MAIFSQNPLSWKSLILSKAGKVMDQPMQWFQGQVGDWANQASVFIGQLQSAVFLAGILNGSGLINGSAFSPVYIGLNNLSSPRTVSCSGATCVSGVMSINVAFTLNLTLVPFGIPIQFRVFNAAVGALTLIVTATTPSGGSYANVTASRNNVLTSLISGISIPSGAQVNFTGATSNGSFSSSMDLTY